MVSWIDLSSYILIWTIFGTIHSILASQSLKKRMPLQSQTYRVIYNIINTVMFIIVLFLVPSLSPVIYQIQSVSYIRRYLFVGCFMMGVLIFLWGLSAWDISGFLGLKTEVKDLNTNGPYRFSRHPVYSGIILILISFVVIQWSVTTLSWLIGAGGYFVIGTIPEENKLGNIYGEEYQELKQETARLFPWKPIHFKRFVGI